MLNNVFEEISVNKIFGFFLVFLTFTNCSLDTKSGLWTKNQTIKKEKNLKEKKVIELFKESKILEKEFNSNVKIRLNSKSKNNSFVNNLDNNNGRVNYDGELKSVSRFKYSKIENFEQYEPDLIFDKDNIIFFDNKGSILKFNNFSKLVWKKNFYSKRERKKKPFLFFANNYKTLIVADTIAKLYAINIATGDLLWSKNNVAPFNSQIKIYKDKFYVVDFENILRCYSINDGKEIWTFKTEKSIIKSQKKLSVVIINDKVYFSNSIGDISAVDIETGNLIWQTPTQTSDVYESSFFLKTSDLIADSNTILFSNNYNEFFSLDILYGSINWKQNINSTLRPTLIDQLIFTITMEGFLVVIDNNKGDIIRITNIFDRFNKKKRSKIKPEGFIVGNKNIYLTTSNGRLLIINILSGKTEEILKIDRERISRPFVLNQNLFIIKNNAIIKLN